MNVFLSFVVLACQGGLGGGHGIQQALLNDMLFYTDPRRVGDAI